MTVQAEGIEAARVQAEMERRPVEIARVTALIVKAKAAKKTAGGKKALAEVSAEGRPAHGAWSRPLAIWGPAPGASIGGSGAPAGTTALSISSVMNIR